MNLKYVIVCLISSKKYFVEFYQIEKKKLPWFLFHEIEIVSQFIHRVNFRLDTFICRNLLILCARFI